VAAPGVRVRGRAYNGLTMTVEFVVTRPPERAAMRMVGRDWLFEKFAGTWVFSAPAPGLTRARFRYSFQVRWLRIVLEPVVRQVLLRDTRRRLESLKRYCESGAGLS
jgi:ribosome-associated toxin RatA of RatAB toxin-antitoxin module